MTQSVLPALTPDETRHSHAVERLIRDRISAAGGWLSFDTFMELALYAPGLGYYSAGSTKLGAAGDFVTAPEVSDLFSRCVARQCAEVGGDILEFGAGTGRMAAVVLESLAQLDAVPEHYFVLEVSADLRERQRQRISSLPEELRDRVVWLDRLPATPITGVILANEVLDALPVHRFVVRDSGIYALGVDSEFKEQERPADPALSQAVGELLTELREPLPEHYRSEICLRVEPWLAGVSASLKQGVMLAFDYGLPRTHYYHPERDGGTLRCHFKQRAHNNPFINLGVQDITAWVDFSHAAAGGVASGFDVLGFVTQAAFLLGCGIEQMAPQNATVIEQARWASEARQLLLPGEMGEAFKVIALGKNCDVPLRGFALQDLRRSL